jgi:hypothetical protein
VDLAQLTGEMVNRMSSSRNVSADGKLRMDPKGVAVALHSLEITTATVQVQAQIWPVYRDGIFWSRQQGQQHGG